MPTKLNPNFPDLKVPPMKIIERNGQKLVVSTPEEDFINRFIRKGTDKKTPQFLREIYWLLQNPQIYNRVLCVAPRGFAKSTVVCVNDTLYDILVRSNKQLCEALGCPEQYFYHPEIILITASKPLAVKWISKIKWHLTCNEKILAEFGNLSTDGKRDGIWQQDHIKVQSPSGDIEVMAFGRDSAIRGNRTTKVKIDDILKDEEALSPLSSDKTEYWLKSTIEGLFDNLDATLFWIATILAPEDVVDNAFEKRGWSDDWYRVKYHAYDENHNSIWGDKFSNEFLQFKERNMGARAFAAEYMNEPITSVDPIFWRKWMQKKYTDSELPPRLEKILSADLAATQNTQSDFTHLDVLGYCFEGEHKMDVFLLDTHEEKLDPDSIAKKICDLYTFWGCSELVLETQVAQVYMRDLVLREARDRGMWVNVTEVVHPPTKNRKIVHAESITFFFKQGRFYFRDGDDKQDKLVNQLCNFPTGRHDDGVDSITMNLRNKMEYIMSIENEDFEKEFIDEDILACPELGI